ncbi:SDR family NAD(P)-dependent oxidoreductase [Zavarzinia sp. CC-PAN008]|uniref:SDR family NAD(P)-dependent oxidoreductase n=1 Tax=Zavarzinia sp. CC-PAN008 TaxID=3243332 RepID=UPI003F742AE7
MGQLDGRVAIVTGAARGQGEAEARLFAKAGARVVLTDLEAERGAEVAASIGPNALFVSHDVGWEAGWAHVVERTLDAFGRIDILVNNAGIYRVGRLEDTTVETMEALLRVNQMGVFLGMKAVVPAMKAQGGGAILNIASVAGTQATPMMFGYGATKWAVRGMTLSAAADLARHQIRVNAILPGVIDTKMLEANDDRLNAAVLKSTPLRRMGTPEEIAEAALYLCSPAASFVTGAELLVDGGLAL